MRIIWCIAIFLLVEALYANSEFRLEANAEISMIGRVSGKLNSGDFINASLIASGIPQQKRAAYALEMKSLSMLAEKGIPDTSDKAETAENLLVWMHENVLSRYVESQTRMDVLLDNGRFNCVSSAVMYMYLIREQGIPALGVLTSDHAFVKVLISGQSVDVETTTPYGFDPGSRKEAVNSFSGLTGFRYVPPGNYRMRTDIEEKEVLSLIYQNRIALLQQQNQWVETVGLSRDRYELAGTEAARRDYVSSLNNYGAYMDSQHRETEALHHLLSASKQMNLGTELNQTAKALLGNAVTRRIQSSAWQEAADLLEDPDLTALVPDEYVAMRVKELRVNALEGHLRSGEFEHALQQVNQALQENTINKKRWGEFIIYLYSKEARMRTENRGPGQANQQNHGNKWLNGYNFLLAAPDSLRSVNQWKELEENYRQNSVNGFHNIFVREYRRRDFEAAGRVLDEAMKYFPQERILLQDREKLQ